MFYCSQQGHYIAYTLHITFKICNARRKFYTFLKLHLVRDISRSSRQDPQCILCIIVSTQQRVMCKKSKLTISECSYYLKTIMNLKGEKWTKQRPKLMYAKEDGWTGNVCMKINVYNNLSIFYCHIFQPGMCVYVTDCTFVCKKKSVLSSTRILNVYVMLMCCYTHFPVLEIPKRLPSTSSLINMLSQIRQCSTSCNYKLFAK